MSVEQTNEKQFESDIEEFLISPEGGYVKGTDVYDPKLGLYVDSLIAFVQTTQPKEWARFVKTNQVAPERKFRKLEEGIAASIKALFHKEV